MTEETAFSMNQQHYMFIPFDSDNPKAGDVWSVNKRLPSLLTVEDRKDKFTYTIDSEDSLNYKISLVASVGPMAAMLNDKNNVRARYMVSKKSGLVREGLVVMQLVSDASITIDILLKE